MEAARRRAGLILAALALSSCGGSGDESCSSGVRDGVLPSWARTGFSEAEPRVPHVVGAEGRIAGVVFGGTLSDPPADDRANKILWVAREPSDAPELHITARQGDAAESRSVDLGPSTVDLPEGCWDLTLEWDDSSDSVELVYE